MGAESDDSVCEVTDSGGERGITVGGPEVTEITGWGLARRAFWPYCSLQAQLGEAWRCLCEAYLTGTSYHIKICLEVMLMRTTLDLEEELLREAMKLLGVKTKREAVERALQRIIAEKRREQLRAKLGQLDLALSPKDLEEMRRDD